MAPAQGAAPAPVGNAGLNVGIFALFVAVTLYFVYRASRTNRSASDYYAAGRTFTGPQNGVAIAGDYLSAASFLGIAGAIALNGYDGFLYSIGFLVAWLVALLLVAELMRNTGKFTMGGVLAFRMPQRPVRAAAAGPHPASGATGHRDGLASRCWGASVRSERNAAKPLPHTPARALHSKARSVQVCFQAGQVAPARVAAGRPIFKWVERWTKFR